MGLGAMLAVRMRGAADELTAQALQARINAEAGLDTFANFISGSTNWRSKGAGVWFSDTPFGKGSFSVQVSDPVDGDLANRTTDPVLLRVTGVRGAATHIAEVRLAPVGRPIGALAQAITANGRIMVMGGKTLNVNGAAIASNTAIRLDGNLYGSGQSLLNSGGGSATGGMTTLTLATLKTMPSSGVQALYTGLATPITGSATKIDKQLLCPTVNTMGGGVNAAGVYVLNASGDVSIKNMRLYGTLIINAPGKKVNIGPSVFMQTARADYPVLIVNGEVNIDNDRTKTLDESAVGFSLNPAGAPYLGITNTTQTDSYPSEIRGLVHVKEQITLHDNALIRGALISESTDLTDAIHAESAEVVWDPGLFNAPPVGYTGSTQLMIVPGSWKQIVLP